MEILMSKFKQNNEFDIINNVKLKLKNIKYGEIIREYDNKYILISLKSNINVKTIYVYFNDNLLFISGIYLFYYKDYIISYDYDNEHISYLMFTDLATYKIYKYKLKMKIPLKNINANLIKNIGYFLFDNKIFYFEIEKCIKLHSFDIYILTFEGVYEIILMSSKYISFYLATNKIFKLNKFIFDNYKIDKTLSFSSTNGKFINEEYNKYLFELTYDISIFGINNIGRLSFKHINDSNLTKLLFTKPELLKTNIINYIYINNDIYFLQNKKNEYYFYFNNNLSFKFVDRKNKYNFKIYHILKYVVLIKYNDSKIKILYKYSVNESGSNHINIIQIEGRNLYLNSYFINF
jgi:hypothetical protein